MVLEIKSLRQFKAFVVAILFAPSSLVRLKKKKKKKKKLRPLTLDFRPAASFGTLVSAPMIHYWYRLLEAVFAGKDGLHIVIAKLVVDQILFSPLFFVVYYIYMALWDGNMHEVPKKVRTELVPVSIDSAKVWVPVQVRQITHLFFVPSPLVTCLVWQSGFSFFLLVPDDLRLTLV
jgi:hypothetical protein